MNTNFRVELAKLFALISIGLVLLGGVMAHLTLRVLLTRILIGGGIFTVIGFFFGLIIDQHKVMVQVNQEKEKMKARIRANYDNTVKKVPKTADDFSPLQVEKLTKIIVDSMED